MVNLAASANQGIGTEIGTDQIKDVENVTAGDGDNTLTGTTMANTLSGGGGNDSITGGGGADTLLGGADDDVLRVPDTTFQVVDGGSGADVLQLTGANLVLNLSALRANEDETPTPR